MKRIRNELAIDSISGTWRRTAITAFLNAWLKRNSGVSEDEMNIHKAYKGLLDVVGMDRKPYNRSCPCQDCVLHRLDIRVEKLKEKEKR